MELTAQECYFYLIFITLQGSVLSFLLKSPRHEKIAVPCFFTPMGRICGM